MPTVLVTGTSSGIGEQIALHLLAQPGTKVFGVARRQASDELASHANYTHIQGDVVKPETVDKIRHAVGPTLDGVVFNVGVLDVKRIEHIDVAEMRNVFEINVMSVVLLTQALLPALRASRGRAIYVSSSAAREGFAGWSVYGSSKAAVDLFALTLSKEEPITVLSVDPGIVDTPMQASVREKHVKTGEMSKEDSAAFAKFKDEGVLATPQEVGAYIGDLALHATQEQSGKFLVHKPQK